MAVNQAQHKEMICFLMAIDLDTLQTFPDKTVHVLYLF